MARFTFTIESEEEHEMTALMGRLFAKEQPTPGRGTQQVLDDHAAAPDPVRQEDEIVRRRRRTKAEIEADKAVTAEQDDQPEAEVASQDVTLDMVKAAGSKAMGTIKASGVAAIFAQHGGGAESFGSLDPNLYGPVYAALVAAAD